jgi:hypothetical protein
MKIFLSWSGARSKRVAEALKNWLPQVIQAADPWISTEIEKGARWAPEIGDVLEKTSFGIICLTPENLAAPWILFEAGALSKTKEAYVCTFLLDVPPSEVSPPLSQFQHTVPVKDEVQLLVETINRKVKKLGEVSPSDMLLTSIFETYWPQLQSQLEEIKEDGARDTAQPRSSEDILREILTTVRTMEKRQRGTMDRKLLSEMESIIQKGLGLSEQDVSRLAQDQMKDMVERVEGDKDKEGDAPPKGLKS